MPTTLSMGVPSVSMISTTGMPAPESMARGEVRVFEPGDDHPRRPP